MPKSILIVEDDPFLGEMYVHKLEEAGFSVEITSTAEEALRRVEQKRPDLILLDIVLPKMDGFEFLRTFWQKKENKQVIVVVLSNVGQKEEIQKALALGVKDYIIKAQFTPSEVAQKLKEILK